MPRIGNLEQCKIYKIQSMNNPERVYYGHTCQTLAQRFTRHKSNHNKTASKQIIGLGDAIILLVEDYPCESENEARAREGFYILNNPCVNKQVAGRTQKESTKACYEAHKLERIEYAKEYNSNHKEKITQYMAEYNLNHKDQISEYNKKYILDNKEKIKVYSKGYMKQYMKQYRANKKAQTNNINNNNAINQEIDQPI